MIKNNQIDQYDNVEISIERARNKIIDRMILASILFGVLASLFTMFRDSEVGINFSNTILNFTLVGVLLLLWFFRSLVHVTYKSAALFIVFFFIAVKSIQLLGTFSSGLIYLAFCGVVIVLSTSVKKSIFFTFLLSLIIPIIGYMFLTGSIRINENIAVVSTRLPVWLAYYFDYILISFILILGIGQMRNELMKNFSLISSTVDDLKKTNKQLNEEIEVKNAYEEKLILSNQKIKGLFDSGRDGILVVDSDKRVVEANPAIMELTGYGFSDLKNMNIIDLVSPENREFINSEFRKLIAGEIYKSLVEVIIINSNNNKVPVELNSSLLITDEGVLVMAMIRDITSRIELENQKFNAVLEAEERERERFSKDLHDDLGPVFSTLKLYLQTLGSNEKDEGKKEVLDNLSGIVDGAVKQVREISHNMSPYLLRDHGLVEAINVHIKKIEFAEAIKVNFNADLTETDKISMNMQVVLYRIFLELLNNTLKHAGADEIRIELRVSEFGLEFNYIDNGKGFDIKTLDEANAGIGIKNIINRLAAVKGTADFAYINELMTTKIRVPL